METAVRTPLEIFNLPQHLDIPLFQRPYVWDEELQWQPLWQDIRRLAELRLAQPSAGATHFLGAIVLQASINQSATLQPRSIIDGQQRLTTLQLLLDATAAAFEARDLDHLAAQLNEFTHNARHFVRDDESRLKLRHTNRDRAAFAEVMDADPPVDYGALRHGSSLIARAHQYFFDQVEQWLGQTGSESSRRAEVLATVIARGLQLVVIDLRLEENSQEIFETLNARGTPLTAADLIKNFVFQRLVVENVDTKRAYAEQWPFETQFWDKQLSVGRFPISRSSLFLNQWLISRVAEEVGPTSTFTRFKHYIEYESGVPMQASLRLIHTQAATYQTWTERAADPTAALSRVELCVYRMQAAETEVLKPLLLWVHDPEAQRTADVIDGVVAVAESWLMRRSLLRLTLADAARVIADAIRTGSSVADQDLVERLRGFFGRLDAESTYWPGDDELRARLIDEAAYSRFKRGRLRMFLEAAEDQLRGYTSSRPSMTGSRVARQAWHVEHLMPQKWQDNWPVSDVAAESNRAAHIHRLGNLTLLTGSLNSRVSNGPWLGAAGKRARLAEHDVFLLNRAVRNASEAGWTEELIDQRTKDLVDAFIATWPVPEGHIGQLKSRPTGDISSVWLKDLIDADLIPAGTLLTARPGNWPVTTCEVLPAGDLALDGRAFGSPSAAAHHVRHGATNGWWFWHLPDGRRLMDVRAEYLGSQTIGQHLPVRDVEDSTIASQQTEARSLENRAGFGRQSTTATRRLVDATCIPEGTAFTVRPRRLNPASAERLQLWLAADRRRAQAAWQNDPISPLVWAIDRRSYSPSGLGLEILRQAAVDSPGVEGTRWWVNDRGLDLVELAATLPAGEERAPLPDESL